VRILVTGAGGGLARAFLATVPSHHDVTPLTHGDLDVGDHDAVLQMVPALAPDLIVNCAAYTDVDGSERDPGRAYRDNAQGPHSLALAAAARDAVLLHVSTDYVFDGAKDAPYDETDTPRPLSVYGRAKLAGERFVRQASPAHFVVRTGHLYGAGSDHLSRQVARLRAGDDAAGLQDRVGAPIYVVDLAERLLPLALTRRFGTYHLGGAEPASWFEVLLRCRDLLGASGAVVGQRAADLDLPAARPRNAALASVFLPALAVPAMPSLDDALARFLSG
jgi:dTDP-4-dehydrorhamnose reductase